MTTITLQHPVTVEGQQIDSLTLRRPKVKDRLVSEKASGSEAEKEVRFLANLCEIPPSYIEELDMADYVKLQEALADFLS